MKKMFGYIRVSTAKQGEGVSLSEQKHAIEVYANRNQLKIERWFEEKETAAKSGRPVFSEMLKLLRKGEAQGVIIHKIDRSARNLRDWADIGELIDAGIEIHFAHEALDLAARSGRLSADIQAVIAADYIRNLRQEVKKGIYGRLRQGLYPLGAPIGYLDTGPGNVKKIDPVMGPLIQLLFKFYSTGRYGYHELAEKMYAMGLRNKRGGKLNRSVIGKILHNPFYIGLMRINVTGEIYQGTHQPLISKSLYDRVDSISKSRTAKSKVCHNFLFRKRIFCGLCDGLFSGEMQKGRVYYRCHTRNCPASCLREDFIERELRSRLEKLELSEDELLEIERDFNEENVSSMKKIKDEMETLTLRLKQNEARMDRLSDKFIDDQIDQETYNNKKGLLLHQIAEIKERIAILLEDQEEKAGRARRDFEPLINLVNAYDTGNTVEKQELLDLLISNFFIYGKTLVISMKYPYVEVEKRRAVSLGAG